MLEPAPIGSDPYWTRLVTRIEAVYIAVLPFLGGWAAMTIDGDTFGWVVAGGWLLAVINLIIHVPMVMSGYQHQRKPYWRWLSLLAVSLLATRQGLVGGSAWGFFLDDVIMESCALLGGFAVMLIFGKGISGDRAWSELGAGMVILVVAFLVGAMGGFVIAWVDTLQGQPWWSVLALVGAFVMGIAGKVILLKDIGKGKIDTDEHISGQEPLIIGMIFLWLFGMPLLAHLILF
ncbi:MAG: hypothetical protein AAF570_05555 [Bacteroidota bacterium]